VKLTGVRQRAKIAVVRPVKRRVRLFGFGIVLAGRCGLVEGFGSGSPIKSLSLLLSAWIFLPAVEGMMAKLEVRPNILLIRPGGSFNASDGWDSADRVGSSADHESVGDCGDAYSLQNGGSTKHAA
jgi:hypothetical protein